MQFVGAKSTRRYREDGKDTVWFHKGSQIPASKIEAFRIRRKIKDSDLGFSSACGNLRLGRWN